MKNHTEELQEELEQELNIEDEAIEEEETAISRYDITSYGIDFDVEGLVRRVKKGEIFIPDFQRNFVWKLPESSRLIESLLLGLPVPGVFLAKEPETGKMLVIDGQQRLMSLRFFFDGYFKPDEDSKTKRVFRLNKVQPQYEGKTYETLDANDRMNLENCVIHATVVKQDSPADNDTSIYHIFERLNSGGRKLTPQEIRSAVYHGPLINLLSDLNMYPSWRNIYGKINDRMKDQELILRFFAMYDNYKSYDKPMTDFLSKFCKKHRSSTEGELNKFINHFKECSDVFERVLEVKVFRLVKAINVALFETAMVGLALRIDSHGIPSDSSIKEAYNKLIENSEFIESISQSTANPKNVRQRFEIATRVFMEI